jgi:hypothetical protein
MLAEGDGPVVSCAAVISAVRIGSSDLKSGLQGWRVVNNNIETKVNTLVTSEK